MAATNMFNMSLLTAYEPALAPSVGGAVDSWRDEDFLSDPPEWEQPPSDRPDPNHHLVPARLVCTSRAFCRPYLATHALTPWRRLHDGNAGARGGPPAVRVGAACSSVETSRLPLETRPE